MMPLPIMGIVTRKKGLEFAAAQRAGRLFHREGDLLQNRHRGADGIGVAADHQRNDHDGGRAHQDQRLLLKEMIIAMPITAPGIT